MYRDVTYNKTSDTHGGGFSRGEGLPRALLFKRTSLSWQRGIKVTGKKRDKTNFIKVVGRRGGYLDVVFSSPANVSTAVPFRWQMFLEKTEERRGRRNWWAKLESLFILTLTRRITPNLEENRTSMNFCINIFDGKFHLHNHAPVFGAVSFSRFFCTPVAVDRDRISASNSC